MDEEPAVSSNDDGDHVFEWLARDPVPPAHTHPEDAHRPANGSRNGSKRERGVPTHARLDPLTVQGVINRVLVLVFCLLAVGATYEAFHAVSSSRTTSVIPSLLTTTTVPKVAATVAPKQTLTTHAPATTVPRVAAATTTVPVTTPRTTPATTPRTTPRTSPPATFPHPVVPQTTPHTIQVPATTPTTTPSGPSDTVVVPFK